MKMKDVDSHALLSGQLENGLPPSPEGEISILDLLIVLGARKRFIVGAVLVAVVASALLSLMIPVRFKATTTLLTPQQPASTSSLLMSQLGNLGNLGSMAGGLGMKNPADMYVALLKSRSIEDAMVRRFGLASRYKAKRSSDARERFEGNCLIETNPKDGLIRVSIQDGDPKFAAEMANAYIDEYKRFSANLAVTEASQRRLFFEKQIEQAKGNLAIAEENFKRSEQSSGMIQLDSQARALIAAVASLRAEIIAKEVQISALSASETSSNPDIVLAKEQLGALHEQLKQLGGAEASSGSELIVPRGKIPEAGLDYVRKLRDVKYYETIFELMARQYELAKLDEAKQGAIIQVVDPAVVPDKKSSPKRALIVLIASFSVFALAVILVLYQEWLATLRRDSQDNRRLETLSSVWSKSFFSR